MPLYLLPLKTAPTHCLLADSLSFAVPLVVYSIHFYLLCSASCPHHQLLAIIALHLGALTRLGETPQFPSLVSFIGSRNASSDVSQLVTKGENVWISKEWHKDILTSVWKYIHTGTIIKLFYWTNVKTKNWKIATLKSTLQKLLYFYPILYTRPFKWVQLTHIGRSNWEKFKLFTTPTWKNIILSNFASFICSCHWIQRITSKLQLVNSDHVSPWLKIFWHPASYTITFLYASFLPKLLEVLKCKIL